MSTLLIMRHAKSSHEEPAGGDHARPLDEQGRRDAPAMARRVAAAGLLPDRILCSTARRARETAELFVTATGYAGPVDFHPRLYHADVETLLEFVTLAAADRERVLLVGHNPGLQELVALLTGHSDAFPTAAIAVVELPDGQPSLPDGQPSQTAPESADRAKTPLVALWRPDDDVESRSANLP